MRIILSINGFSGLQQANISNHRGCPCCQSDLALVLNHRNPSWLSQMKFVIFRIWFSNRIHFFSPVTNRLKYDFLSLPLKQKFTNNFRFSRWRLYRTFENHLLNLLTLAYARIWLAWISTETLLCFYCLLLYYSYVIIQNFCNQSASNFWGLPD